MHTKLAVILAVLAAAVSGCTLVLQGSTPTPAAPSVPPGLTASAPVVCELNQELTLHNLYITGQGPGVTAQGNCVLTIEGSTIDVSGVAMEVLDNATVTLRSSRVSGTGGSASISGNGTVNVAGSVFVGRHSAVDNGSLKDEGGNTFN